MNEAKESVERLGDYRTDTRWVDTGFWRFVVKDGVQIGFIRRVGMRAVSAVLDDLRVRMEADLGGEVNADYFEPSFDVDDCDYEWPEGDIEVVLRTGGSEGHYVRVYVVPREDFPRAYPPRHKWRKSVLVLKTFAGAEYACRLHNLIWKHLGL